MTSREQNSRLKSAISAGFLESARTMEAVAELGDVLYDIATLLAKVLQNGGKIMFCGNGGSAADSQHLAAEFIVRLRSEQERGALPALALTTDTSLLTACSNDYSFDVVFARQVEALGQAGDALIGFSTSGNSRNIIQAFETAAKKKIHTVLFSGGDGGKLKDMAEHSLIIPSERTMRIQEAHIAAGHIMVQTIEDLLYTAG